MEKNLTYIIGAGASYHAVPVVDEMEERLRAIIDQIALFENINKKESAKDFNDFQDKINRRLDVYKDQIARLRKVREGQSENVEQFIDDLKWLYNGTTNHASVDTFAKKLYIRQDWDELNRLKFTLSAFLTIEQLIHPPDNRYDKFFATIMKDLASFPENISIISWNYDFQFELAYDEYSLYNDLVSNAQDLKVVAKNIHRYPVSGFNIIKLNGDVGMNPNGKWNGYLINKLDENSICQCFDKIINHYIDGQKLENTMSFAWEVDNQMARGKSNIIDLARTKVEESSHVVVIGYSFPYFNAEVDKKLLSGLDHSKIQYYVQDPNASKVITCLKEITKYREKLKVQEIDYKNEFFIPYDFFGS